LKGTPVTRPLLLHFWDDERARNNDSEFMLGENILVAPYLEEGGAEMRDVYLPGPATWIYLWQGTVYEAPASGSLL
jgi:alpha-glucosidase (family GH31 glycosyl hydrolase)